MIHLVLMRELAQSHLSKTGWPGEVTREGKVSHHSSRTVRKRIWDIRGWSASLWSPGRFWRKSACGSHS